MAKATGPPPFFLQDPTDSMCLGGEDFRRCSIDTLFFVVGKPGEYQIHKRPADDATDITEDDDGICLGKKSCSEKDALKIQDAKLTKCTHCGAKNWNILGDSDTGYVLTEGDGETKVCLVREKGPGGKNSKALIAPCDSLEVPYTPLQLQFASASDIAAMASPAARFIGAASDGNIKKIKSMIKYDKMDVNERDWDQLTALIPAASQGHVDIVKLLLKEGADVNAHDKDGITALMEASIMGHAKVVELLIGAGAEVDAKANSHVTALWLAAGEGRVDVMKVLLKNGADAMNARVDSITALMTASVSGRTDAVKLLLENGADATNVDGDGLLALHNAAENGTEACVRVLVDAVGEGEGSQKTEGEDGEEITTKYVDTMSLTGFTPLIIAAAHGHTDAVKYLINTGHADVSAVHDNGVSSLMYAAASGHVDTMKALIDDGKADVNQLHTNGGSALLEASTGNSSEAVKFLLESGAKDDLLDEDGVSPLMAVASQGNFLGLEYIVESLKKHMTPEQFKEHMDLASYSGGTAVMFSAAGGHPSCTKALIDLGADVNLIAQATPEYLEKLAKMIEDGTVEENEPHVDGVTALHVAAQGGHLEDAVLLTEAGIDVSVLDDEDRSALQVAVKGNYGEVASALVKAGADPNTLYVDDEGEAHNLLMDAIIVENGEFAELLIENGADLYHQDEHGVTTLLQASHRGMTDTVKLLLEKDIANGADGKEGWVDVPSDEGITPLTAASSEGHRDVVDQLITVGKADVDVQDKDLTNAIMAASARGHVAIVELLVKAGAKVNEQNVDGHTALMFAYNGKNQVETLWERYNQFVSDAKDGGEEEELAKQDDAGTGKIIEEALESHTKMVDILMKHGADAKIKDKEGHTAKDFDFHPDADTEVIDKEKEAEKKRDESKNEL